MRLGFNVTVEAPAEQTEDDGTEQEEKLDMAHDETQEIADDIFANIAKLPAGLIKPREFSGGEDSCHLLSSVVTDLPEFVLGQGLENFIDRRPSDIMLCLKTLLSVTL